MKVILISGKAQHGKDTSALYMKDRLESAGSKVLITHYADLLKFMCTNYFGWDGAKDEKGRELLQYIGTDIIRKRDAYYWIDYMEKMIRILRDQWDYVLIPDCRFPNEVYDISGSLLCGGIQSFHVRINREHFESPLTPEQQRHISEVALDDSTPDFRINNNGSLNDLKNVVENLIDAHFC